MGALSRDESGFTGLSGPNTSRDPQIRVDTLHVDRDTYGDGVSLPIQIVYGLTGSLEKPNGPSVRKTSRKSQKIKNRKQLGFWRA